MTSPARAGTTAVVAVLGATALLLVLVTWAASIGPHGVVSGGHIEAVNPTTPTAGTTAPPPPRDLLEEARNYHGDRPVWATAVAFALELLTICVGVFLAARLLRRVPRLWRSRWRLRRRRDVQEKEDVEFEVVDSAQQVTDVMAEDAEEQRSLLEIGGEPRNAIVECWHRFELQAQRAGVQRRVWQTTSEFVLGVLDVVGADRGAVSQLADLYREARFSDHPMTDEHRARALAALDAIHSSLRPRVSR